MKITFLGTSSMVPTKERNHPSILISNNNENILVDCGEGTQRQLKIASINPCKITKILLTHLHNDHVLGLPGLLQTLHTQHYSKTLEIYGPTKTISFINQLKKLFNIHLSIKTTEITKPLFFENKEIQLKALKMKHNTPCLAYSISEKDKRKIILSYTKKFGLTKDPLLGKLQQGKTITYKNKKITPEKATKLIKGKKISLIYDTSKNPNTIKIAQNADLLITESTYSSNLEDKAKEYSHLTSQQAAEIAKKAKVKQLILTHFSQRYKDTSSFLKEAKEIFKNTKIANDFLTVEV
ncbi:ribonuclease Z [archaeon]|nr:ribonuclease Z [archaeon]|tara:strand:- start:76 stop:960 length:885 start_codon:yes stop_codon:yes gene_type:complete